MSSRRYPVAELYDERQRDFYRNGHRSDRSYDELDIQLRESHRDYGDPRRSQPDFLREDYGRTSAGPLVVRDRDRLKDEYTERASSRGGGRRDRDVEKEEIIIRDSHSHSHGRRDSASIRGPPPPREREIDREEITYRRDDRSVRGPPPRETEKEEIIIRRREEEEDARSVKSHATRATNRTRPRTERDITDEEIIIRRSETEGPPRPPPSARERDFERDDIRFRRVPRGPPPGPPPPREVDDEEIIFRHEDRDNGRGRNIHKDEIIIRDHSRERSRPPPREPSRGPPRGREESETIVIRGGRERSLPPPRLVKREEEDFVLRRRATRPPSPPSPPPPPREEKQEIIIRRTERERSPSPAPSPPPPPPPEPEPIIRPPIVQEIITHHRHIDHGVERARSPSPPPPPPSPPKEENLEISINRRSTSRGRQTSEEIIIRDRKESSSPSPSPPPSRAREEDLTITRRRSEGNARRRYDYDDDIASEADFYNRKATERGYPGEAYNGATKDWGLVDVPPGTRKVRMDGLGGAAQEITWQQYNGARRSKFITEDGEYPSDYGRGSSRSIAPAPAKNDMWTEITKDLVIEDAIKTLGYEYKENESFFYVQEYLRYEDVLKLVEMSDDIRRDRSRRIREIEWERDDIRSKAPSKSGYDERVYEREIIYDRHGRRHR